jgi:hypothetical protein
MIRFLASIFVLLALFGCKQGSEDELGRSIARVDEVKLYEDDLKDAIPEGISKRDSAIMARAYANNWLEKQVLLQAAKLNLSDVEQDVDDLVEKYRNSLLIFKYESKFIRSRLDTTVTEEELENHYKENRDNFILNEPVYRIRFLDVDSLDPINYKYWRWIKSDLSKDLNDLEINVEDKGYTYIKSSDTWYRKSDMLDFFPDTHSSLSNILGKMSEGVYTKYLNGRKLYLYIEDVKKRGSRSPLQFSKDEIRLQIVNKRRTDLTRKLRQDAVNNALNKKNAEFYMDSRP